ncbi:hypothetical protein AB0F42_19015 [Streptomyces buecherae]|uniref:hypothetical protein n=1 Tax=Streptomyces buecherae TaxID=2763006 RepID=UPI0033E4B957
MTDNPTAGRIRVDHNQYLIYDATGPVTTDERDTTADGLTTLRDGQLAIQTGIHSGDIHATIQPHTHQPEPAPGDWDEIIEISLHSPSGELLLGATMHDLDEELASLATSGPGPYRLRIHARGRDTAVDLTPDDITEHYTIQAWPAQPTPPTTLKTTDNYGTQQRNTPPLTPTTTSHEPRGQAAHERDIIRRSYQNDN